MNEEVLQKKIGFVPHKGQSEVINSSSRDIAICAGRRWGKSAICAYIALKQLLEGDIVGKPIKAWIVSPTYDLSQRVFEYLVKWFLKAVPSQKSGISSRPLGGSGPQIKTASGGMIQCKSAENPQSLLGEELDLRIMDEASRIPKNVEETYLFPATASRKGRTIYISTQFGKNWFYHKWIQLKGTNGAFQFKSIDNPNFPIEEWERAKATLPEQVFKQEYEALFLDDAASVFRNIALVLEDTAEDALVAHFYVIGVDLGKHEDFTAISVIDMETNEEVFKDRFNQIEYPFQKARIKATADRYNHARIYIDSTVVGEPIKEDLERMGCFVDDFKFSTKSKKELIEKLSIYIEQKYVKFQDDPLWNDELESFGYRLTDKNVIYSAPEGQHDDTVYARALAVWGLWGKPSVTKAADRLFKKRFKKPRSYI